MKLAGADFRTLSIKHDGHHRWVFACGKIGAQIGNGLRVIFMRSMGKV